MPGQTTPACCNQLLYELGMKAGHEEVSHKSGAGQRGAWELLAAASPLTRAGLGRYTTIPQFQLLPGAPLCLPAPGY